MDANGSEFPDGTNTHPNGVAAQGERILWVYDENNTRRLTIENDRLQDEIRKLRDIVSYREDEAGLARNEKLREMLKTCNELLRQRTEERDSAEAKLAVLSGCELREKVRLLESVVAATEQFISAETNANTHAQREATQWLAEALKEWREFKRNRTSPE